jgi:hypothetical protein
VAIVETVFCGVGCDGQTLFQHYLHHPRFRSAPIPGRISDQTIIIHNPGSSTMIKEIESHSQL